jgi:excisionase family DNA binding protein
MAMIEKLISYPELSQLIGFSVRECRTLVAKGVLPYLKLGHRTVRFRASEVERALKKREVKEVA